LTTITEMLISSIAIGERVRKDMGDIAALSASIEKHGLLHPPAVTSDGVLIAGHRRILACTGLGMVQLRYNGAIDQKAMATKLAPVKGGAPGLLGNARALHEMSGRPVHHCVASIIVDIYNKGRRTDKLEEWEVANGSRREAP
jgi:hypothetical protein